MTSDRDKELHELGKGLQELGRYVGAWDEAQAVMHDLNSAADEDARLVVMRGIIKRARERAERAERAAGAAGGECADYGECAGSGSGCQDCGGQDKEEA